MIISICCCPHIMTQTFSFWLFVYQSLIDWLIDCYRWKISNEEINREREREIFSQPLLLLYIFIMGKWHWKKSWHCVFYVNKCVCVLLSLHFFLFVCLSLCVCVTVLIFFKFWIWTFFFPFFQGFTFIIVITITIQKIKYRKVESWIFLITKKNSLVEIEIYNICKKF